MEHTSYFTKEGTTPTTDYVTPNMHRTYVVSSETNNIMSHALRNTYCDSIKTWLQYPFTNYGDSYNEMDEYYDNEMECHEDEEEYDGEEEDETNNVVQIKDVVDDFYDDVTTILYDAGYSLHDSKLFKEDFIYLIYKLSVV